MSIFSVDDIKNKIIQVVDLLNHTRNQRDVLLQENARLTEELNEAKKSHEHLEGHAGTLQGKLDELQAQPVGSDEEDNKRVEVKSKIRELAAEIDKCIAMLNQEK